jgi:hypothetical protein
MSSLSPSVQAVVQLFEGPLAGVRFADIDGSSLGHLATEVEEAARQVQAQEAQLAELKQVLTLRQDALLTLAQRALSYARVYAEGDEALTAELSRIALPRPNKPRKKDVTSESSPTDLPPLEAEPARASVTPTDEALDASPAEAKDGPEAPKKSVAAAINRRVRGRPKADSASA